MDSTPIRRWVENPAFDLTPGQRYSTAVVLAFGISLFAFGMPSGSGADPGDAALSAQPATASASRLAAAREAGVALPASALSAGSAASPVLAPTPFEEAQSFAPPSGSFGTTSPLAEEPAPAPPPSEEPAGGSGAEPEPAPSSPPPSSPPPSSPPPSSPPPSSPVPGLPALPVPAGP